MSDPNDVVLGIDPGFRHTGGVEVDVANNRIDTVWAVHSPNIENEDDLSVSKRDFMASLAMVRGIKLRCYGADERLRDRIKTVVVELPHGGAKSSRAARSLGIITGILAGLADTWKVPFMTYRPAEVKKALTGKGNASKDKVEEVVIDNFGENSFPSKKKDREHMVDAAAAVMTAYEDCGDSLIN